MSKYDNLNPRTELEQSISIDLQETFQKFLKFKVKHNGTATSPASGGKPDIVCESKKNIIIFEVTQIINANQANAEATPIIDHLNTTKKEFDKPTYCFFISPKTHHRTFNLFKLNNYNSIEEGKKDLRIFSQNFECFEFFINELKKNGKKYKEKDIIGLFEKVLLLNKDSDSLAIINELIKDNVIDKKIREIKEIELIDLEHSLIKVFQKVHDILWNVSGKEPQSAFNEFSKILFIKIQEQHREKEGKENRFRREWIERAIEDFDTKNPINDIVFNEYVKLFSKEQFFDENERLLLTNDVIIQLVELLDPYTFIDPILDIKGKIYEQFLASQLKGEKLGQYFTPREIISFTMDILQPGENDIILDPFCGTARFLLEGMKRVESQLQDSYSGKILKVKLKKLQNKNLIGFDNSEIISKTAKRNMFLNGDGRTGIKNLNTFTNFKRINASIIATNPPFGKTSELETIFGKFDENRETFNKYPLLKIIHKESKSGSVKDYLKSGKSRTQILAIQQYVKFISKNGKIITVIDDGVLNTESMKPIRDYIKKNFYINAVFSLPNETFLPYTPTKTSLLYLTKRGNDKIQDFPIFFGYAEKVGKDSTNRPCRNDLPFIYEQFNDFEQDKYNYSIAQKYNSFCYKVNFEQIEDRLDFVYYDPRIISQINTLIGTYESLKSKGYILNTLEGIWINSKTGKTPAKRDYITEEELEEIAREEKLPILKVKSLTNFRINWENIDWVPVNFTTSCPILQNNDILLTSSAHNLDYIAKKVDIVDFNDLPEELKRYESNFVFVGELLYIRPNTEKINPYYLLYFLRTSFANAQIRRCITGQSAHLYPEDIADKVLILIPPDKGNSFSKKIVDANKSIEENNKQIKKIKDDLFADFNKLLT